MIRVLVVDDSPTARSLIVAILTSDPDIEIVGEADNGVDAVALTCKLRPDVITMDLRMPRMDGYEATKEIMIQAPTPIIIVTSSIIVANVESSMHTLRAGALAVLAKPAGPGSRSFEAASQDLIVNVKLLSQVKVVRHWRSVDQNRGSWTVDRGPPDPRSTVHGPRSTISQCAIPVGVVAIAASTGGPAALHRILSELPGDFPVPILIVQHITQGFSVGLADWLNKESDLRVKMAEDGEPLARHTAYLAPDGRHLGLSDGLSILLANEPPMASFRPSANFLFEAAARVYRNQAICVMLTGMGDDGVQGLQAVRQAGGRVFAQDEESSVVYGMPAAAVAAGLVDQIVSLECIAQRLVELVTS